MISSNLQSLLELCEKVYPKGYSAAFPEVSWAAPVKTAIGPSLSPRYAPMWILINGTGQKLLNMARQLIRL